MSFSVVETFAGREVLLTGVTGFVGKVWLVAALSRLPGLRRVHVVLRGKGSQPAADRFAELVATSPAFDPLEEAHGDALAAFVADRVRVYEGYLTLPLLGLDDHTIAQLRGRIDLVVNCAAVVDFEPDVRIALATNTHGPLAAAELAARLGARLLHVSTCFVAGRRDGRIGEVHPDTLPNGAPFDAEREYADLVGAIEALDAHHRSEAFSRAVHDAARVQLASRGREPDAAAVDRHVARLRDKHGVDDWKRLGVDRASERGWPNTYTYTKALAERLLHTRYAAVPHAVLRPAVVESARAFPFPGWNEGFNTCGPLAYLIGTWFKALPGRHANPFDVAPVDDVVAGMLVAGAALLRGEHRPVYHAATADRNRLTLGRANELTGLGQRAWLRRNGETFVDRFVRSRADTTLFDGAHPLSLGSVDAALEQLADALRSLPEAAPERMRAEGRSRALKLDRQRRAMQRVTLMVDAFKPFTRDLRQSFVADALSSHSVVEPELRWEPERIDWRKYWLDVHMPGMRTWCFPLIEGDEPPRRARRVGTQGGDAPVHGSAGETVLVDSGAGTRGDATVAATRGSVAGARAAEVC